MVGEEVEPVVAYFFITTRRVRKIISIVKIFPLKKITKYYCGKCKEELKSAGGGFDTFSFMNPVSQRYCPNDKCSR